MMYEYKIREEYSKSFSFGIIPHFSGQVRYVADVYLVYKTPFFKIKRRKLVWTSNRELHRVYAEMSAQAIIDVLNHGSHDQIHCMLIDKWGYKPINSKIDWSDCHPEFYKEDFEPFYSQWMDNNPEYVKLTKLGNGLTIKEIDYDKYDTKK